MKPNEINDPRSILKTGTSISDSSSWLDSLINQIKELREERKHPRRQIQITAEQDPSALNKLLEMPSPVRSLFSDLREAIDDLLHPRKIETTVQPVEVEEIWSKPKTGLPKLISVFVHVLVVGLALVPWATSIPKARTANETAVLFYYTQNLLLPLTPDQNKTDMGDLG